MEELISTFIDHLQVKEKDLVFSKTIKVSSHMNFGYGLLSANDFNEALIFLKILLCYFVIYRCIYKI